MNEAIKSAFLRSLDEQHKKYDENECMTTMKTNGKFGYHTKTTGIVHPTYPSLCYAVALLDSGDRQYVSRATDILRKVIPLQDTNQSNNTYGIWS